MRSIRFVSLMLVSVGILCAASQADARVRRSRGMHTAYAQFPPVADKGKSADKKSETTPATKPADKAATDKPSTDKPPVDKKADATPVKTDEQQTTTRRRGFFKRRTVTQATAAAASVAADNGASPFRMVSDPAPAASATPATPAPAPEAKQTVKTKRKLFARRRFAGRRMKTASA
jgi:hypothetical protein